MKILVLNGSPRPRGVTTTMLRTLVEAIGEEHTIEWVDVCKLKITPCMGCLKCRPHDECILPTDDGHRIWHALRDADAVLVGTPVYWGNMTAQLKTLFDRLVTALVNEDTPYFPMPRHRGKRAVVVTACICPAPFYYLDSQAGGTLRAVRTILGMAGFRVSHCIKGNSQREPQLTAKELARLRSLARTIIK